MNDLNDAPSKFTFWLLLVVPPALALFFWWRERARQKLLTQFIEARLLSSLTIGISPARRKIRFALLILAVALLDHRAGAAAIRI